MAKRRATTRRTTGEAGRAEKVTRARRDARKVGRKASKKPTARRAPTTVVMAAGGGLDLITAGEVVQDAVPGGPHDIDSTLEAAVLITAAGRATFRADVVKGVSAHGCTIDAGDVPNAAATTLRAARTSVQQNAR
jgi:hypothetical protein